MLLTTFVIVESPFAPTQKNAERAAVELARNHAYVSACMADCFNRGEVPFASHAIYTRKGVLDDTKPEERKKGIEAGFLVGEGLQVAAGRNPSLYKLVRAFYQDRGWSTGMVAGMEDATSKHQERERRNIGEEWSKDHDSEYTLNNKGELVRIDSLTSSTCGTGYNISNIGVKTY